MDEGYMLNYEEGLTDEGAAEASGVERLVGRDEVKEMLYAKITRVINELIREHELHPQEAADVLVEQAKAVLDAMFCYACTANGKGDYDNKCWLDSEMENCWIKNKPARKEDCEYWERVYRGEL